MDQLNMGVAVSKGNTTTFEEGKVCNVKIFAGHGR